MHCLASCGRIARWGGGGGGGDISLGGAPEGPRNLGLPPPPPPPPPKKKEGPHNPATLGIATVERDEDSNSYHTN